FVVDTQGQTWGNYWDSEDWHEWYEIRAQRPFAGPAHLATLTRDDDHMEVFGIGGSGKRTAGWYMDGNWNDWFLLPAATTPLPDEEIPPGEERIFTLGKEIWVYSTVGMRLPLYCSEARLVCRQDGSWQFNAFMRNTETDGDCSFDLYLRLHDVSRPFDFRLSGELGAPGDKEAAQLGRLTQGFLPEARFQEEGHYEALTDPAFFREVFTCSATFTIPPPGWTSYITPPTEDPE
ncbi:hypothetical protein AB0R12_39885, partial [Streptomyces niveus]|uniref:hypothetical protein n=1 Tax=Streptomyces niveus TaxID=193462 RepID=UPI0034239283